MSAHAAPPAPGALRVAGPYVRPERWRLAGSAALAVLEVGLRLCEPWPLALVIDHALGGRPLSGAGSVLNGLGTTGLLVAAALATILITAAGGVLDTLSRATGQRAAERIGGTLREVVFGHVLVLSLRWHDRMRTGELVSRLTSDVGRILDALVAVCTSLVPNVLLLAGALTLLLTLDPSLAWLGLMVLPVLAWLTARQRRRVRSAELAAREASGRLAATATDLLRNVRAVQAFGRVGRAASMFGRPNDDAVDALSGALRTEARWAPIPDVVLAVGTAAVLVAGGLQVREGLLTVGELLVALMYLGDLQAPVRSLVRLTSVRAKANASAVRLREVLDSTEAVSAPAVPRPVPPLREGMRLESVSFAYSPDRPVLDDVDLTVGPGETVCLFG